MDTSRHDVSFESRGATLRGWLYPGGDGPGPAVVMAHGLSAVKEMFLDDYAAAFAAAGLTTLVYDHLGFGASDGEPRQSSSAEVQLQGYRDAVAWLAGHDLVDPDRIGLWGTSFSGGHVIVLAAEELPVACAVAQVPFIGEGAALPAGALAALLQAIESGDVDAVFPAVSWTPDGDGVMYEDHAADWMTRTAATRAPSWRNELRIAGVVESSSHVPLDRLPAARVPLLLIVAPDDRLTPPGSAMAVAAVAPNVEVVEIEGGHFDAYEAGFAASSGAAVTWFRRHLADERHGLAVSRRPGRPPGARTPR